MLVALRVMTTEGHIAGRHLAGRLCVERLILLWPRLLKSLRKLTCKGHYHDAFRPPQDVAVAKRTALPNSMLWCTTYCCGTAGAAGAQRAAHHLSAFLAGRLEPLPSSGTAGAAEGHHERVGSEEEGESDAEDAGDVGEDLEPDEYLVPPPMSRHWQPLQTFVVMPELPRG